MPLVSTATGGLMPGVSLDDSALLQELDDKARVERFK